MPYNVNYTDNDNKTPITVFDNTSSTDTSLVFPGRNVTGYGQIIAENFLHLLENFAKSSAPVNAVEGQLWYESTNGNLNVYDGTNWRSASGIQKGPTEPAVDESKAGELWVDTTNQQLRIYSGTRWILVGPQESSIDGLRYGPIVENVVDTDNVDRYVLIFYIKDIPVTIVSKDSFTPKVSIPGFLTIKAGMNVNLPANTSEAAEFIGGLLPKLYGTATAADSLIVSGTAVESGKFLRSDITNTLENGLNVRSNVGITFGLDSNFVVSSTATEARIYNRTSGSSIDLRTNRSGTETTVLRIIDNKVGINKLVPNEALDITGNIAVDGTLVVSNNTESTNLSNGSIRTAGGVSITKNLRIGTGLDVTGTTQTNDILPKTNDTYDLGSTTNRWDTVRAKTIIADTIQGVLDGNISGNSNTANNLKNVTTFRLSGDVISPAISFDGQIGSPDKVFVTSLTSNIIDSKEEPFPDVSQKTDYVLTYRASESGSSSLGLLKQSRNVFVGDLGVPMGAIMPYAGTSAPYGYLLCDGSEVERTKFPELYDVLGTTYNGTAPLLGTGTFRLPDLRGRFALGRDNMDNGSTVPTSGGSFVDAGGGDANRVSDTVADQIGQGAGSNSVSLTLTNLPEHTHSLTADSIDYNTLVVGTGTNFFSSISNAASADISKKSNFTGTVRTPSASFELGTPVGIMNPYLTINYIIRSGPPVF